jgi:hypothetical protein
LTAEYAIGLSPAVDGAAADAQGGKTWAESLRPKAVGLEGVGWALVCTCGGGVTVHEQGKPRLHKDGSQLVPDGQLLVGDELAVLVDGDEIGYYVNGQRLFVGSAARSPSEEFILVAACSFKTIGAVAKDVRMLRCTSGEQPALLAELTKLPKYKALLGVDLRRIKAVSAVLAIILRERHQLWVKCDEMRWLLGGWDGDTDEDGAKAGWRGSRISVLRPHTAGESEGGHGCGAAAGESGAGSTAKMGKTSGTSAKQEAQALRTKRGLGEGPALQCFEIIYRAWGSNASTQSVDPHHPLHGSVGSYYLNGESMGMAVLGVLKGAAKHKLAEEMERLLQSKQWWGLTDMGEKKTPKSKLLSPKKVSGLPV